MTDTFIHTNKELRLVNTTHISPSAKEKKKNHPGDVRLVDQQAPWKASQGKAPGEQEPFTGA